MTLRATARGVRLALLLTLVVAPSAVVAACGGGDDEATTQTTTQGGPPPARTPTEAVDDFVAAVAANNRNKTWTLLSTETKRTFRIDFQHWADVLLPALRKELKPGRTTAFSKRFGDDRAFVVLAGTADGAPFPLAVHAEDGGWRIEMFYPEYNPTRPAPGERVQAGQNRMLLDVIRRRDETIEVRIWLDGTPITPRIVSKGHFLNTYDATYEVEPGKHLFVAYATTGEGLSGGTAWQFTAR